MCVYLLVFFVCACVRKKPTESACECFNQNSGSVFSLCALIPSSSKCNKQIESSKEVRHNNRKCANIYTRTVRVNLVRNSSNINNTDKKNPSHTRAHSPLCELSTAALCVPSRKGKKLLVPHFPSPGPAYLPLQRVAHFPGFSRIVFHH